MDGRWRARLLDGTAKFAQAIFALLVVFGSLTAAIVIADRLGLADSPEYRLVVSLLWEGLFFGFIIAMIAVSGILGWSDALEVASPLPRGTTVARDLTARKVALT